MQAFFLPLNLLALVALGPTDGDLSDAWWAVAGCALGVVAGSLGVRRIPPPTVRWAMLAVAATGGARLIVSGTWQTFIAAIAGSTP